MPRDILSRAPVQAAKRVHYGKDPSQFYDVFGLSAARPSVIMIHGGFWRPTFDLTNASHLCAALARTGLTVASLEYRRSGWPATYQDVLAGFTAAAAGSNPVVMGHSAGGQLALRLSSEELPIRGVVALAPVACIELAYDENLGSGAVAAFLGGKPDGIPSIYADADPVRHLSRAPRILIHGTDDDVVPISNSKAYVEARRRDPATVRLIEIPGADHFDLIDPASFAWPTVLTNVKHLIVD